MNLLSNVQFEGLNAGPLNGLVDFGCATAMKNAAVVTAIKAILVPHMATMSGLTRRSHQTSFPLPRHVIFYALNGTALTIADRYHRCMPKPGFIASRLCFSLHRGNFCASRSGYNIISPVFQSAAGQTVTSTSGHSLVRRAIKTTNRMQNISSSSKATLPPTTPLLRLIVRSHFTQVWPNAPMEISASTVALKRRRHVHRVLASQKDMPGKSNQCISIKLQHRHDTRNTFSV